MRRSLAALLVVPLLALGPPAVAGEREMTQERAGAYYTKHVCPVIKADREFVRKVWHGRRYIYMPEIRRRLNELQRLSKINARAHYAWARALFHPPNDWPSDVARQVDRMAQLNVREANLRWSQQYAGARRWATLQRRINDLPYGSLAPTIRARLDLPRTTRCRT